ncbi:MAG: glycosyltransferase, partial [Desulfobaccales bacterium]
VIEAMACGLPVVISDRVNIWREVEAAGAGLVTPCAPDPLAAALERLVVEVGTAADMGRRGQELVARRFQWDSIALDLQEVYSGIIANYPKNR